jgi:hypothetical protein
MGKQAVSSLFTPCPVIEEEVGRSPAQEAESSGVKSNRRAAPPATVSASFSVVELSQRVERGHCINLNPKRTAPQCPAPRSPQQPDCRL